MMVGKGRIQKAGPEAAPEILRSSHRQSPSFVANPNHHFQSLLLIIIIFASRNAVGDSHWFLFGFLPFAFSVPTAGAVHSHWSCIICPCPWDP